MARKEYSSTPLYRKLGIAPGHRVAWPGAPEHFAALVAPLPQGVTWRPSLRGRLDVVVLFARTSAELRRRFPAAVRALEPVGGLWVAYPKRSSGLATDLTFEVVQRTGLDAGLVDNKVAAIDEDWTAVRFVYRVGDRR